VCVRVGEVEFHHREMRKCRAGKMCLEQRLECLKGNVEMCV
jgi:hypothetical protein